MNIAGMDGIGMDLYDYLGLAEQMAAPPTAARADELLASQAAIARILAAGAASMLETSSGGNIARMILREPWKKAAWDPDRRNRNQRAYLRRKRARQAALTAAAH
jgi:hypothetical protein